MLLIVQGESVKLSFKFGKKYYLLISVQKQQPELNF